MNCIISDMLQPTTGAGRRLTPSRRPGTGRIVPSLKEEATGKEGVTGNVLPALPGVNRKSP
jgi:hypothetical protein